MTGFRLFVRGAAVFTALVGSSLATPPQIIGTSERFFGSSKESFTVLRRVDDNLGSYYKSRAVTSIVERSMKDGSLIREIPLLDLESIVDANHVGPGDPAVKKVVHFKNEKDPLGSLLEQWPTQGEGLAKEELQRFTTSASMLQYDQRVELIHSKEVLDDLTSTAPLEEWKVEDSREAQRAICLKLVHRDEDGDSREAWISIGPEGTRQVKAFRGLEEACFSLGVFDTEEEALKKWAEWKPMVPSRVGSSALQVWKTSEKSGKFAYRVILGDFKRLVRELDLPEIETALGAKLTPISTLGFQAWVPLPEK